MRYFLLIACLIALGCKKDSPKPPEAALLVFPLKNSECTTGESISATTTQVEFKWQAANNATMYELTVTNLNTNQDANGDTFTTSTSEKVVLEKGVPYSWSVISKNNEVQQTATSETWQFYNAGSQTTYAPFRAQIVSPASGASVVRDINNETMLEWTGADVDNDIEGYEVYVDTENPPSNLAASPSATSIKFTVESNTVYYWKVITKDSEGNTSDSGVYEFKVL